MISKAIHADSAINQPFQNTRFLQHIGKIEGDEKVVMSYYDICNLDEIQIISINHHLQFS
jgi:hypothetical protein